MISLRERIQHSSLASKIAMLGLFTTAVSILAGILCLFFLYSRYKISEDQLIRSRTTRIEYAITSLEKEQGNFVHDYGVWNEMADAVTRADTNWIHQSFVGSHQTFGTDIAFVFDTSNNLLVTNRAEGFTEDIANDLFTAQAHEITSRTSPTHIAVMMDGSLWQIMAGPIVSHTDPNASIVGKLVIGRKWDQDEMSYMEQLLDANISLKTAVPASVRPSGDLLIVPLQASQSRSPIYFISAFQNHTLSFFWDSLNYTHVFKFR